MATDSSPLVLHPLTFVVEGDDVLVGRSGTDSYAVLPADGAALLKRMAGGASPAAAAAWYERTYRQPVDIGDFTAAIAELGFVRAPGEPPAPGARVRLQRLSCALASRPALALYVAVILAWVLTIARHTEFAPHAGQVFFAHSV